MFCILEDNLGGGALGPPDFIEINSFFTLPNQITGTANDHMLEACYIRNGVPNATSYAVSEGIAKDRITLATLVSLTGSVFFNKFTIFLRSV